MDIHIRSSTKQFWVENLLVVVFAVVLTIVSVYFQIIGSEYTIIPSAAFFSLMLYLFYQWLYIRSFYWTIGQEVIQQRRGLFSRTTDHVELYRIIDYQENQNMLQRMLDIKTVVFLSTDKLNSTLCIKGVCSSYRLMDIVRGRVEVCKHQKRIYEITNN